MELSGAGGYQAEDLAGGPTDATMDVDWRCFLSVFSESFGVVVSFLF